MNNDFDAVFSKIFMPKSIEDLFLELETLLKQHANAKDNLSCHSGRARLMRINKIINQLGSRNEKRVNDLYKEICRGSGNGK